MNSTGVAIATSPCQPHHLHCLRVPAPCSSHPPSHLPREHLGLQPFPTEQPCPACPRRPPSSPPAVPAPHTDTQPGGLHKAPSSPRHPLPQEPGAPNPAAPGDSTLQQGELPCAHLLQVIPSAQEELHQAMCVHGRKLPLVELIAGNGQGGPVPLLHLPGHDLFQGSHTSLHALGTCRWSGIHFDAALTPLCILLILQRGRRGLREVGSAGHCISGQAGPADLGHFPTTCLEPALPLAPSTAIRGSTCAPATHGHEDADETLGSSHCAQHQGPQGELNHRAGSSLWRDVGRKCVRCC